MENISPLLYYASRDILCVYHVSSATSSVHIHTWTESNCATRDAILFPCFSSFKRVSFSLSLSLSISHPDPSAFLLLSLLILSTKTVHSARESAGIHAPIDITVKVSRRYRNYYTG